MNSLPVRGALMVGLAWPVFAQGPLTPPGAPAPTQKTLSQIEPRTDIATLPAGAGTRTISQPGSYYLTANLNGETISIQASNVTVDLGGFTLQGSGAFDSGIIIDPSVRVIRILNGVISGFGQYGVNVGAAAEITIENVSIDACGAAGVYGQPVGATLQNVSISNSGGGASLGVKGTSIRACHFSNINFSSEGSIASAQIIEDSSFDSCAVNVGTGSALSGYLLSRCGITNITLTGGGNCIVGSVLVETAVDNCNSTGALVFFGISGNNLSRCSVTRLSASAGLVTGISSGGRVDSCIATDLTAPGGATGISAPAIYDSAALRVTAPGSAIWSRGIDVSPRGPMACGAYRCTVGNVSGGPTGPFGGTTGTGIYAFNATVENCSVTDCGTGVEVHQNVTVRDCTISDVYYGIVTSSAGGSSGNRIDGNNILHSFYGALLQTSALVVRNNFKACAIPIFESPPAGSQIGEIVTATGTIPSATGPWANFSTP
jgi:hypothetical protein